MHLISVIYEFLMIIFSSYYLVIRIHYYYYYCSFCFDVYFICCYYNECWYLNNLYFHLITALMNDLYLQCLLLKNHYFIKLLIFYVFVIYLIVNLFHYIYHLIDNYCYWSYFLYLKKKNLNFKGKRMIVTIIKFSYFFNYLYYSFHNHYSFNFLINWEDLCSYSYFIVSFYDL